MKATLKSSIHSILKISLAAAAFMLASTAQASNDCADVNPSIRTTTFTTKTMVASDGLCVRSFAWQPTQTPVRGIVVITHGIRDYALRYQRFAEQLTKQGFVVLAQDLRGHAHSGGERQRFDSMARMVEDTDMIVNEAKLRYPNVPLYVYGHSLGGLITARYSLDHADKLSGVVLSGAALMRPHSVSGFSAGLAQVVAAVAPGLKVVQVDDSEFSKDKAVMAALATDPLISRDKLPAATAAATLKAIADAQQRMSQLKRPLLVIYGTADSVNPIEGSQAFVQAVASTDKTLKAYPGVYHDMLNEPERDQIAADVIAWLVERTK
jgi:alpha-beta hydrolase superfamily lysophospholipase